MTRIIAGRFGGRTLATPRGETTRPTTERVREALFSRLEHLDVLSGARVLDLYAGSGALAFEALSRGATTAVLVEAARSVASVAVRNAKALGCAGEAAVVSAKAEKYSAAPELAGGPFSLVIADPPYDVDEATLAQVLAGLVRPGDPGAAGVPGVLGGHGVLTEDAVVVVERSSRSPEPTWPAGLERFDERTYGETRLWFAEPVTPGDVGG